MSADYLKFPQFWEFWFFHESIDYALRAWPDSRPAPVSQGLNYKIVGVT